MDGGVIDFLADEPAAQWRRWQVPCLAAYVKPLYVSRLTPLAASRRLLFRSRTVRESSIELAFVGANQIGTRGANALGY